MKRVNFGAYLGNNKMSKYKTRIYSIFIALYVISDKPMHE